MKHLTLLQAALLPLALALSSCSDPGIIAPTEEAQEIRQLNDMFDDFARLEIARSPETASRLGLSHDRAGYDYTSLIDDRSQAAFERTRLQRLEMLQQIQRLTVTTKNREVLVTLRTTTDALQNAVDMATFGHGQVSLGYTRPYVADQLSGAYSDLPDLLINRQIITNRDSALDYIDRLAQVADAIDDDGRRMTSDAATGIVPPDFILQRMSDLAASWAVIPEDGLHPLVISFDSLSLSAQDTSETDRQIMLAEVKRIVEEDIVPAFLRFADTVQALKPQATSQAGIWAIKDGDTYYKAALSFYTGTDTSPENHHQTGVRLASMISDELDIALAEAGLTEGTVGERLATLSLRPDQLYPNTLEGKALLLETLAVKLDAIRARQDELVGSAPRTAVAIAQVPIFLEANAPGGYYAAASADGTTPGLFYINLRDTAEWPAFTLPTLLYHETIPGHHLESAVGAQRTRLPLMQQLIWLPAYGEGWALYAEDLADEIGVYADDPLGRIGYLQSLLFRAARLVADTGIHHKRWSRDDAVDYLVSTTGQSRTAMQTEVDRYVVWPGQAAAYMTGREFIRELRNRASGTLRSRFSLTDFNDVILSEGPRPRALITEDVEAWIEDTLQAR